MVIIRRLRDKPGLVISSMAMPSPILTKKDSKPVGLAAVFLINLAVEEGHPKAGLLRAGGSIGRCGQFS
jgi:hypothetical protein